MEIPKILAHIWIGPLEPPLHWMTTWTKINPEWDYRVYDNNFVSARRFRNQTLIDEYMRRAQYAGVADLIRYELLTEVGGFIAPADSVSLRPIAEIFETGSLFTVFENEYVRGKLVSPILASTPNHPFVNSLIERLEQVTVHEIDAPWKTTGNLFVAKMIDELHPEITIFPSHYLIPEHYTGMHYEGDGPVYARQFFGSTNYAYVAKNGWVRFWERRKRNYRKRTDAATSRASVEGKGNQK